MGSFKLEPLKRLANGLENPDFFSYSAATGGSSFFFPKSKNEKIGAGGITAAEPFDPIEAVATLDLIPELLNAIPPILLLAFGAT